MELLRNLGNVAGALPFTVQYDADGRVRRRRLGETTARELLRLGGRRRLSPQFIDRRNKFSSSRSQPSAKRVKFGLRRGRPTPSHSS